VKPALRLGATGIGMAASAALVSVAVVGPSSATNGVSVKWDLTSNWTSGFEGTATITNNTGAPLDPWSVTLLTTNKITSYWNATSAPVAGGYKFGAPSWATALANGSSVVIGFDASRTAGAPIAPTACAVVGTSCTMIGGDTASPTPTAASSSPSPSASSASPSPTSASPSPSTTAGPSTLPTPIKFTPKSTASGVINYHLNLPYGSGNVEKLTLSNNYTDLITSNFVSGALLGRLLHEKDPNLAFNKDYVYGSLFAQLLQENINTGGYTNTTDWINSDASQRAQLLASGQGGPYQINDYSKRLETPAGIGLVNFSALQKGLGYSVDKQDAATNNQTNSTGPDSLDQKYFGPMAAAYFHLNDYNRLVMNNADTWGPQYQYYNACMANLRKSQSTQASNNMYDMILNAAYNAGTYSAILKDEFRICAGMYTTNPEMTQLKSLGDYTLSDSAFKTATGSTESAGSTFILYPRQIRLYLDQMFNQKTFNSGAITGTNSINLSAQDIGYVFQNSMGTLAYINSAKAYNYIAPADSAGAYAAALSANGLTTKSFLDIGTPAGKSAFFKLLDDAINNVATNLNIHFGDVTQTTIGATASASPSASGTVTPTASATAAACQGALATYPTGRGTYASGTCVKGSDGATYVCLPGVAAWCNSPAEWAYAPGTGSAWSQAWSKR